MSLWQYKIKSMLCFASIQLPPQKWKSMSHISDLTPKKKAEVCSKTCPEEGQGVEAGKKYVEQGINLNASNMCWQMGEDLTN